MNTGHRATLAHLARRRLWILPLALAVAWIAAYSQADETQRLYLYATFGATVLSLMLIGIRLHRPEPRRPWLILALGMFLLTVGDVGWFVIYSTGGEPPFPSILDVAYLAGYLVFATGVLLLFRGRLPGGDRAGLIDALIFTCGVGILVWIFLMAPYLSDDSLDTLGVAVAIAYPLMDVLLVGVVARVLLAPTPRGKSFPFLLGFLGFFSVTDFAYGFLVLEGTYDISFMDAGWIAGAFCIAAATLHPSMRSISAAVPAAEPRLGPGRLAMLALACLVAPAAFVIQELRGVHADVGVVVGGWIILFLLVLARLTLTVDALRTTLTQRRRLEHELEYRALHDPLTGLANRHLFGDRLGELVSRATRPIGVLFIDLDDFKAVNDTMGHEAGDDLLVGVANRIQSALRPSDLAARLGGDEFAILLADLADESNAELVANRILDALRPAIPVGGRDLFARASVGIAVGEPGAADASELMRNADIAMYLAKGQGKHQAEVFRPTLHADIVQRLGLRTDLERAIAEGEFVLHYQPLVRLADGATIGAEALVRWAHPTRGLVLPGEFIPAAESTGLIVPLGRWILDESVRQAAVWLREFERPIAMSVNLSAIQLEDPRLVDDVRAALERHALPPSSLVVEVTESRVLDTEAIIATLDRIKALGVRVAIDDFGTGYSSFSCLARLTADYLKVDRSFVGAIGTERREGTVGGAIVQLGSSLGLATVAEGIETPEQLERLRELGVPYGQGFLLARPMPATELGRRLADTNAAERAASPVPGALGRGPGIARHGYSAA